MLLLLHHEYFLYIKKRCRNSSIGFLFPPSDGILSMAMLVLLIMSSFYTSKSGVEIVLASFPGIT